MPANLQAEQRARILDLISEGPVAGLCDASGALLSYADREKGILLDLTAIKNADGSIAAPGVATDFRLGLANQPHITGFPSSESEVSVSAQIEQAVPVQREISAGTHNAVRLSIHIPSLFKYDDQGARTGTSVSIKIELKRTAEGTWRDVTGAGAVIQGTSVYPYVRQYRVALYGEGPWDLKVTRLTADTTDPTKLANDTWWQSYTLISDYKLSFRHSCIGAVEMEAKQNQSIRPRAYRMLGQLVRVPSNYNPATRNYSGTWDGNFAGCAVTLSGAYTAFGTSLAVTALAAALPNNSPIKITSGGIISEAYLNGDHASGATSLSITPIPRNLPSGAEGWGYELKFTTNPAWIWFDVATHKRYGVGHYVPEATIDKWGLYSISRYCDGVDGSGNFVGVDDGDGGVEPRFSCSAYIANQQDAYKVLADLASAFRGMIYWGSGLIMAVQDAPKDPQFTFTNANVINGLFSYSGSARKARHTVAYVRWNDPADYFKAKVEQVLGDQADMDRLGIRDANVSAFGCTSQGQAQRVGKWLLLTEKYEQETVMFRAGLEGARCRPGSIVRIRDRYKTVNRMAGRLLGLVPTPLITPSLNNGGMETAGSPLGSWTAFTTGTGAVTRDTTIFRSGVASAKFAVNGPSNTAGLQRTVLTVGHSGTLGFWARCGTGTGTCFARLSTAGAVTSFDLTEDWKFCELTEVAGATTFQIGSESIGDIYVDDVELTDNDTTVNALKLDAPVVITTDYSLIVTKDDGTFADLPVTTAAGTHQTLTVTGSLTGISPMSTWVLRSPSLEPTLWRIMNGKELERNVFEISALKYIEGKFANVEDGIALNLPPTSDLPNRSVPTATADIDMSEATVRTAERIERRINVAWEPAAGANVRGYKVEMRYPGNDWFTVSDFTTALAIPAVTVTVLGRYEARVTTLGYYGLQSVPAEDYYDLTEAVAPIEPDDFTATGIAGGFQLKWTDDLEGEGFYRLFIHTTSTRPDDPVAIIPGGTSEWAALGFAGASTRYFWLQPVLSRVGVGGGYAAAGPATSLEPSAKLVQLTCDGQVFRVDAVGSPTPSTINFVAYGQNLSGSPTFSVLSGTATLTGTGTSRALAFADLTTDAAVIKVAWDGQEDVVSVVKLTVGLDGDDTFVGTLDNDTQALPCDSAGSVLSFAGADSTLTILRGDADDSANWTFSKADTNCTSTLIGQTATVTAMSADAGYVDITATRSGFASITKRFSVSKAKGGVAGTAYWLVSSVAAIGQDLAGAYTPATITVTGKTQVGAGAPAGYSTRFIIADSPDGTTFTDRYTSASDEASKTYTPLAGIAALRIRMYVAGGTSSLLDEEIIPIVYDGDVGDGAITGLLTNEAHLVPCDAAGTPTSFAGAVTQIVIYEGISDDSANWTISKADTNCTSALSGTGNRTCTVSALSADVGYVDITAARSGYTSVVKRFTVSKSKTGATGAAGDSAYQVNLTNDRHGVACNAEGTALSGELGSGGRATTDVQAYKGATALSVVASSPGAGQYSFTVSVIAGTATITKVDNDTFRVDTLSTDSATIRAVVSLEGVTTRDIDMIVWKVANGGAYWLVSSVAAVAKSVAGAYTPTTVTFNAIAKLSAAAPGAYSGRFKIAYDAGAGWVDDYVSSSDESSKTYTVPAAITKFRCQLYLAGSFSTFLDEEEIPIVSDGATGATGAAGAGMFTIQKTSNMTDHGGGSVERTVGPDAWDGAVWSLESYVNGAHVSWVCNQANSDLLIGLNADPTTDNTYPSLDYAFYCTGTGTVHIWESGTQVETGVGGGYNTSTVFTITYDGINVRYAMNGTVVRTQPASANLKLHLDSTFNKVGGRVNALRFGPMGAAAAAAVDGIDGFDGAYVSFVFKNATSAPSAPTGGSYDGTTETIPLGYTDDPTTPGAGELTYVSKGRYYYNGSAWVNAGWSTPAKWFEKGDDGIDGDDGADGGAVVGNATGAGNFATTDFTGVLSAPATAIDGNTHQITASIQMINQHTAARICYLRLYRDSTAIGTIMSVLVPAGPNAHASMTVTAPDTPGAGTYTYSVKGKVDATPADTDTDGVILVQ
jgi:predicted phage tail protein